MSGWPKCRATGKSRYASPEDAKIGARAMTRAILNNGEIVKPLYHYVCPECDRYHLTRREYYQGRRNPRAHTPAPVDAQLWAMTEEHREAARARLQQERDKGGARNLQRLPDPAPVPDDGGERTRQPYANRPRALRR